IAPARYPSCLVSPEQTEGPFYFETKLIRQDITEGQPGTILHLKLKIVDGEGCTPVRDAVVDIWSCDALGEYSGYETVYSDEGRFQEQRGLPRDQSKHPDNSRPPFHQEPNNEKTFMRGAQVTDANGEVEFRTIYPGWYPRRATHIHVKVYLNDDEVFTSQMYFPEDMNDAVYNGGVYAEKEGRRTKNEEDRIFSRSGSSPLVELTEVEDGYVGTLTFGIRRP
ncbi:MAG TPA: intradiol ring-cleavage dioxygenase, partial [Rhodothermales bacterium]|nr:intradiol ring-cleavage dioxygenase [Rhodothermales bacterium]